MINFALPTLKIAHLKLRCRKIPSRHVSPQILTRASFSLNPELSYRSDSYRTNRRLNLSGSVLWMGGGLKREKLFAGQYSRQKTMMGPSSFQSLNFGHISSIIIFKGRVSKKNQWQAKKFKVGHNYSIGRFDIAPLKSFFLAKNLIFSSSSI